MAIVRELEQHQQSLVDVFGDEICSSAQVADTVLPIHADFLCRSFGLVIPEPALGRCVTMAFIDTGTDTDISVALPAVNVLNESGRGSKYHRTTARHLGERVGAETIRHWSGFSWILGDGPIAFFLIEQRHERDLEAFRKIAKKTQQVTYYCIANTAESSMPENVIWQRQ